MIICIASRTGSNFFNYFNFAACVSIEVVTLSNGADIVMKNVGIFSKRKVCEKKYRTTHTLG